MLYGFHSDYFLKDNESQPTSLIRRVDEISETGVWGCHLRAASSAHTPFLTLLVRILSIVIFNTWKGCHGMPPQAFW